MGTVVVGYVPKPEGEAALAGDQRGQAARQQAGRGELPPGGQEFDGSEPQPAEDDLTGSRSGSTRPASSTTCASSCAGSSPPRT